MNILSQQPKKQFKFSTKSFFHAVQNKIDPTINFEAIKGRNPSTWPSKTPDFIKVLKDLPFFIFFQQPIKLHKLFFTNSSKKLEDHVKKLMSGINKNQEKNFLQLIQNLQAQLLVSLLKGSFSKTIDNLQQILNLKDHLSENQEKQLVNSILDCCKSILLEIIYDVDKPQKEFRVEETRSSKKYSVMEIKTFDYYPKEFACCTNGKFIFEVIFSSNSFMLQQVGTGKQGTKIGVIYKKKVHKVNTQKYVSITYLKGKLYIHDDSTQGLLLVYDAESLEREQQLNLDIKDYFKNPHCALYNRNFQIFSDDQFLYTILMKCKEERLQMPEKKEEEQKQKKEEKPEKVKEMEITKELLEVKTPNQTTTLIETRKVIRKMDKSKELQNFQKPAQNVTECDLEDRLKDSKFQRIQFGEQDQDIIDKTFKFVSKGGSNPLKDIETLKQMIENETNDLSRLSSGQRQNDPILDNLRSIKVIKNLYGNSNNLKGAFQDFDSQEGEKNSIFSNFLNMRHFIQTNNLSNIKYGKHPKHSKRRKVLQTKDQKVDKNIQFRIEFYLIKIDPNKEKKPTEEEQKKISQNENVQELIRLFEGSFTQQQCYNALVRFEDDLQESARYLLNYGKQTILKKLEPCDEILIYQTFALNSNLSTKISPKCFKVKENSILKPENIYNSTWFIKNDLLLKSTGQLFSMNPKDEITVEPDEIDKTNTNIFSKRRNTKLHELLQNETLEAEYVDLLHKQLKDQSESLELKAQALDLTRVTSKFTTNKLTSIRTTFIKQYKGDFYQLNLVESSICYDLKYQQFIVITQHKIPETSYNFVRQNIYFVEDCDQQKQKMKQFLGQKSEKQSIFYLLELLKAKAIDELIESFLQFLVWINTNKCKTKTRFSDWIYIYQQSLLEIPKTKKKRIQSYTKKIKKLVSFKNKKVKNSKKLSWINKEIYPHHTILKKQYYLTVKGNTKNFSKLMNLMKNSSSGSKEQILQLLKLLSLETEIEQDNVLIQTLYDEILQKIKQGETEFEEILIQNLYLFSLKEEILEDLISYCLDENYQLFFKFLCFLIKPEKNLFNSFLIVQVDREYYITHENQLISFNFKKSLELRIYLAYKKRPDLIEKVKILLLNQNELDKTVLIKGLRKLLDLIIKCEVQLKSMFSNSSSWLTKSLKQRLEKYLGDFQKIKLNNQIEENKNGKQIIQGLFFFILKFSQNVIQENKLWKQNDEIKSEFLIILNYVPLLVMNNYVQRYDQFENIIRKIMFIIKEINTTLNLKKTSINESSYFKNLEGVSQCETTIIETPHPIERGKNYSFKTIFKQNAIGYHVEFDKRCQDEESSDKLILDSWFRNEPKGTQSSFNNCFLYRHALIHQTVVPRQPIILVGNCLNINFSSSLVAKQNLQSLNQWGYRLLIRPIYSTNINLENFKKISCLQQRQQLQEILYTVQNLAICLRLFLDYFLKGQSIKKDLQIDELLKWNILHNGISAMQIDKFVNQDGGNFNICNTQAFVKAKLHQFKEQSENLSIQKQPEIYSYGESAKLEHEQLKNLDQNIIVSNLINHIATLVPQSLKVRMLYNKPFFIMEIKEFWEKIQRQILMCYIKHTKILKLLKIYQNQDLKFVIGQKNINQQLIQIAKNKQEVVEFMIGQVVFEKDFQNLLSQIFGVIKETCIEGYIKPRIQAKIQEQEKKNRQSNPLKAKHKKIQELIRRSTKSKRRKKKRGLKSQTPSVNQSQSSKPQNKQDDTQFYYLSPEDLKKIYSDKQAEKQMLKIIENKYRDSYNDLLVLLKQKRVQIIKERKVNYDFLLQFCLKEIKSKLKKHNKSKNYELAFVQQNPYQIVGDLVQKRCELLLKLNDGNKEIEDKQLDEFDKLKINKEPSFKSSNKQIEQNFNKKKLKPLGLQRSLTSSDRAKKNNKEQKKVNDWINNYKQWKKNMTCKKENVKQINCSPVFSVTQFLTQKRSFSIQNLEKRFLLSSGRAALRLIGFQFYKEIIQNVENTWLESYFSNISGSIYSDLDIFENIRVTHPEFKTQISDCGFQIARQLMKGFIKRMVLMKQFTPEKFTQYKKILIQKKDALDLEQKINQITTFFNQIKDIQSEIYTLLNNSYFKQYLLKINSFSDQNQILLIEKYIEYVFELNLFCISFDNFSIDVKETLRVNKLIFQISQMIVFQTMNSYYNLDSLIYIVKKVLQRETMIYKDEVKAFKLEENDPIQNKRITFLLKILQHIYYLKYKSKKNLTRKENDTDLLSIFLYLYQQNKSNKINFVIENCLNYFSNVEEFLLDEKNMMYKIKVIKLNENLKGKIQDAKISPATKKSLIEQENNFKQVDPNEDKLNFIEIMLQNLGQQTKIINNTGNNEQYLIQCHFQKEQDLLSLVRVLYYWEQLHPNFSKCLPKSMKEYYDLKKTKTVQQQTDCLSKVNKKQENIKSISFLDNRYRFNENLLNNIPEIDIQESLEKNLGWYFDLSEKYEDFITPKTLPKNFTVKTTSYFEIKYIKTYTQLIMDALKQFHFPREIEKQKYRSWLRKEIKKDDQIFEEYGYCLDLLFSDWMILEEKEAEIKLKREEIKKAKEDKRKKDIEKQLKLKKQKNTIKKSIEQDIREQTQKIRSQLKKQQNLNFLKTKKEMLKRKNNFISCLTKTKSQEKQKSNLQIGRKQSVNIKQRRQEQQDFLESYRCLKILLQIFKKINFIAQFIKYTGQSELILCDGYYQGNKQETNKLCQLMQLLVDNKLQKLDISFIKQTSILNSLKNVFASINKPPSSQPFQYQVIKKSLGIKFSANMNFMSKLKVSEEEFCKYMNKVSNFIYKEEFSLSKSAFIRSTTNFLVRLSKQSPKISEFIKQYYLKLLRQENMDDEIKMGLLLMCYNWNSQPTIGESVFDKNDNNIKVIANKQILGKNILLGINPKESSQILLLKEYKLDHQSKYFRNIFTENGEDFQKLIFKNLKIINLKLNYLNQNDRQHTFVEKLQFLILLDVLSEVINLNPEFKFDAKLKQKLMEQQQDIYHTQDHIQVKFINQIENLMDCSLEQKIIFHQQVQVSTQLPYQKKIKKMIETQKKINGKKKEYNYLDNNLTKSSHLAGMKMSHPKIKKFKMLKYWEKQIIPRIINFIKGSLSEFEIQEYLEQMRIELRIDNHFKATDIAYILCDQKLPANCYIPGLNYDWNSLNLDEIQIGQHVNVKIKDIKSLYSQFFKDYQKLGFKKVIGQVIQKVQCRQIVRVLFKDLDMKWIFSAWIPQHAIRPLNNNLKPTLGAYPVNYFLKQFDKNFNKMYKIIIRDLIFKNLQQKQIQNQIVNYTQYKDFKLKIQFELKGECLRQWLVLNGNFLQVCNNKSFNLLQKLLNSYSQQELFKMLEKDILNLVEFFDKNKYSLDMQNQRPTKNGLHKLNRFKQDGSINGMIVEFSKLSQLYKCSGLKFFKDSTGFQLVENLQATQNEELRNLEPLIFNSQQIYFQFYYNKEALPIYRQNESTTVIFTMIHAIPRSWNFIMWTIDSLSSLAVDQKDEKLLLNTLKLFLKLFKDFKGPSLTLKYIYRLFSRLIIKLRYYNHEIPQNQVNDYLFIKENLDFNLVLSNFENLRKQIDSQQFQLVPNLFQEFYEFLAVYFAFAEETNNHTKYDNFKNIPKEVKEISKMLELAEFLSNFKQKPSQPIKDQFIRTLETSQNLKQFILVQNIPEIKKESLQRLILETCEQCKLKILIPELDIYIPTNSEDTSIGYLVVLYDGWIAPDQQDYLEEEKEESEEQAPVVRRWQCQVCTLLNLDQNTACEACATPKLPNSIYPDEVDKVEEVKEKVDLFCESERLKNFSITFKENFKRLTPDERITISTFKHKGSVKELESFTETEEFLEFLMFRITNDRFSETIQEVCEEIIETQPEYLKKIGVKRDKDELFSYLMNFEPFEMFTEFSKIGYDFWLEKTGCSIYDENPIKMIENKDLSVFQTFFEDIFQNNDEIYNYHPKNFRIEFKNTLCNKPLYTEDLISKLRYKESKRFYLKMIRYQQYSNFEIQCTLAAIYQINQMLLKNFQFINIITKEAKITNQDLLCLNIGSLLSNIKEFFCSSFKNQICLELLQKTAINRDNTPKIPIQRITKEKEILVNNQETPTQTKKQSQSSLNFIQSFKYLKDISPTMLRPERPKGSEPFVSFQVIFKGEHVQGVAGPYRQFFSDISEELQPSKEKADENSLRLLIPTPNNLSETGDFKDRFTINPSCRSAQDILYYEYLGLLMGCCFRTGTFLSLTLPKIFWKKMVKESIQQIDLEELDSAITSLVKFMSNSDRKTFESSFFENFTTFLSDRTQIELVTNGSQKEVTFDNKEIYIKKLLKARLSESDEQIKAIKRGFIKIVPQMLLSCLSSGDLEKQICGQHTIDFEMLKQNTQYSGGLTEDCELIKNFWQVLSEIEEKDKKLFVKFCWGQERLPTSMQAFEQRNTRFMVKPAQYDGNQDGILPRADTCFFNFELPNYSNKEIMKKKILLAIHTDCDSMNAEENQEIQNVIYESSLSNEDGFFD